MLTVADAVDVDDADADDIDDADADVDDIELTLMTLMTLLTLFSMLAYQPNAFLAFSLPLPSHHPFPSFLVVGPHRILLSPGPLVTINNQQQCQERLGTDSVHVRLQSWPYNSSFPCDPGNTACMSLLLLSRFKALTCSALREGVLFLSELAFLFSFLLILLRFPVSRHSPAVP